MFYICLTIAIIEFMKNTFVGTHLDFIGFSTSIACAIHCAFIPFIVSSLPFLGLGFLENPWIEYGTILLSLCLALISLSHGYLRHHKKILPIIFVNFGFLLIAFGMIWGPESLESVITPAGAMLIGIAHYVNWIKIKESNVDFPDCKNNLQ
jgi:hypothetical protein